MTAGLLAGRVIPGLGSTLNAVKVDGISLPIALGLIGVVPGVLHDWVQSGTRVWYVMGRFRLVYLDGRDSVVERSVLCRYCEQRERAETAHDLYQYPDKASTNGRG
jgi:hypothetical protein